MLRFLPNGENSALTSVRSCALLLSVRAVRMNEKVVFIVIGIPWNLQKKIMKMISV
jgi:hypothetical protein